MLTKSHHLPYTSLTWNDSTCPENKEIPSVYRLSSDCRNSCQTTSNTNSLKQNFIQVTSVHFDCYPLNSVPNIIMSLDLQLICQMYKELAAFSPERQIYCLLNWTVERTTRTDQSCHEKDGKSIIRANNFFYHVSFPIMISLPPCDETNRQWARVTFTCL